MRRAQPRISLKGRALQLLAQRDQSRVELRRKLMRHASAAAKAEGAEADEDQDAVTSREAKACEVEAVLDWLEANRYLSVERFAESRVHARQARFGNLRIRSELAQHGAAVPSEMASALRDSELQRAASVRERRFRDPPADAAARSAQARFLAQRGFSPEVVHRLFRQLTDTTFASLQEPHTEAG